MNLFEKEKDKSAEELLDEQLLSQLNDKLKDKKILKTISSSLIIVRSKCEKSKKSYFRLKYINILLTGIITAFSALSAKYKDNAVLSILSIITPILLTIITSIEMLRKYDETWKRHRKHYTALQLEIITFVNGAGEYESLDTDKAETEFKNKIIACFSGNYQKFEENMKDTSK